MSYKLKRRLYESLPAFVKESVRLLPFATIAGKPYRDAYSTCAGLEKLSREEIVTLQQERLGELLGYACDEIPAYEKLKGVVHRLPPLEALKAFPLIDKEKLQENFEMYLPRSLDRIAHYETTTGGTSGNQLKVLLDNASQSIEMGYVHHMWGRVGYEPRQRSATFRGVEFGNLSSGVYWERNPIYNELRFSPYHMNEQTLAAYCDQLVKYHPQFLFGYPSAIRILAEYVLRTGIDAGRWKIKAALLGSEPAFPDQRQLIESAFSTRAFSWYGHTERLVLGGECEQSSAYHHFPTYGVLEIVDSQDQSVDEEQSGEIVGTGLINRSLPLIRYRTGDLARRLAPQCACGRSFDRFDQVEGRWQQEYVIGKNGSRISPAALNMHGPMFDRVTRYQYYQNTPGALEIRLMTAPGFGQEDIDRLTSAYARKTGEELEISFRVVDSIPLTSRGKLRRLIQEIPQQAALPQTF